MKELFLNISRSSLNLTLVFLFSICSECDCSYSVYLFLMICVKDTTKISIYPEINRMEVF